MESGNGTCPRIFATNHTGAMFTSGWTVRRIVNAPARLLAARLLTGMFPQNKGRETRGPNCTETRCTLLRAVLVPKWAKFVSYCKFGNFGDLVLEKGGPKMTNRRQKCR